MLMRNGVQVNVFKMLVYAKVQNISFSNCSLENKPLSEFNQSLSENVHPFILYIFGVVVWSLTVVSEISYTS